MVLVDLLSVSLTVSAFHRFTGGLLLRVRCLPRQRPRSSRGMTSSVPRGRRCPRDGIKQGDPRGYLMLRRLYDCGCSVGWRLKREGRGSSHYTTMGLVRVQCTAMNLFSSDLQMIGNRAREKTHNFLRSTRVALFFTNFCDRSREQNLRRPPRNVGKGRLMRDVNPPTIRAPQTRTRLRSEDGREIGRNLGYGRRKGKGGKGSPLLPPLRHPWQINLQIQCVQPK